MFDAIALTNQKLHIARQGVSAFMKQSASSPLTGVKLLEAEQSLSFHLYLFYYAFLQEVVLDCKEDLGLCSTFTELNGVLNDHSMYSEVSNKLSILEETPNSWLATMIAKYRTNWLVVQRLQFDVENMDPNNLIHITKNSVAAEWQAWFDNLEAEVQQHRELLQEW